MRHPIRNILVLFLAFIFVTCEAKDIRVVNLLCDYEENSLAIQSQHPLLSWQLSADQNTENQSAYRILVSSDLSLLKENKSDYWDSGKTISSESQINYQGKPLTSGVELYWKVMVWSHGDESSGWSEIASWKMGLLQPEDWDAKWIGQREDEFPDSSLIFPAPYFRKEFTTSKTVKKATVYISGLGFYEMHINGKKIGAQVLAPAVTNYDKRSLKNLLYDYDDQSSQRVFYNVFDITSSLKSQNNTIGVILGNGWYNQRDRTIEGHMWYDVPKMILQLEIEYIDGSKKIIASDNSWKTTTGPLVHDAIFSGEIYDARLELEGWNKESYNDKHWMSVLLVRPPTGSLKAQTIPFNKVMRTVSAIFEKNNDSLYTYRLPETVSGWCSINVKGKPGDTVKLRFVSEEGLDYGQVDTYILKGNGAEEWEPRFTWHTFRKIEVIAKNVEISKGSITVKSIYTDVDQVGDFESSNELFNRIHRAWIRTMHTNFKGIISSDPHRERLAYTGDGQVISESLLYTFNMSRFLKKFIDDIGDSRNKTTGYVPHTAPFAGGGGGPAWGSAYVVIPWNYFRHYGDVALLEEHYQGMKQWITYLGTRTDERGIIVKEEPNGWCLGEWCTPYNRIEIPPELVNTAFYYRVTCIMAGIAHILNKESDKKALNSLSQEIKENFNKAFYDPQTHHYWKGKQGADAISLAFKLVPEEKKEKVFTAMLEQLQNIDYHFDTGIFGTPITLQVLTENGRADIAYKIMNQMDFPGYGYLMDDQNSTLWETWDGGVDDPNGSGRCHPMFGSVVAWFYNSLAGIKPLESEPGMKHFQIAPTPVGDLTYCKASYKSLYGKISANWKIDSQANFHLAVTIPVNTHATVIFPKWIEGNIYENGIQIDKVSGVVADRANPRKLEVSSGTYNFVLKQ